MEIQNIVPRQSLKLGMAIFFFFESQVGIWKRIQSRKQTNKIENLKNKYNSNEIFH